MNVEKFNIVILGDGGVGKSSLISRLMGSGFVEQYHPTVEESYTRRIVVDGHEVVCTIFDTAGQEEYRIITLHTISVADGLVLVFDVTNRKSVTELSKIRQQTLGMKKLEVHNKKARTIDEVKFPMILVANKIDEISARQIPPDECESLAKSLRMPYIETSAKQEERVDHLLETMIRQIREQLQQQSNNNYGIQQQQQGQNVSHNSGEREDRRCSVQ